MRKSSWDRLWEKVEERGDCWVFTGYNHRGHGQFHYRGVTRFAHRVAYQLLVGQIPPGLVLDHTCQEKRCVNPRHLDPVTQAENMRRMRTRPYQPVKDTSLGTGTPGPEPRSPRVRFWEKVDKSGDCWLWTASKFANGYGQFYFGPDEKAAYAHRVAYRWELGPIPDDLVVDHMCKVRHCVNPRHLRLLTWEENIRNLVPVPQPLGEPVVESPNGKVTEDASQNRDSVHSDGNVS